MRRFGGAIGEQLRKLIHSALYRSKGPRLIHRPDGVLLVAEDRSCNEVAPW